MRRLCCRHVRPQLAVLSGATRLSKVAAPAHPIDEPAGSILEGRDETKDSYRMAATKNPRPTYGQRFSMVSDTPDHFQPKDTDPFVQPPPIVDPTIVEYEDIEANLAQAEKVDRPLPAPAIIAPQERESLARIIYVTNYRPGRDVIDREDMFAANSEVRWLEEHFLEKHRGNVEETLKSVRRAVLERSDLKKPLSYIIGSQPFFGCEIAVRQPLLCPRPETEWWAHEVVSQLSLASRGREATPLRILDMCAGTGCIGIAIAKHLPNVTVLAADISKDAVLCANMNAARNKVQDRYLCIHSDMFSNILPDKASGAWTMPKGLERFSPLENSFDIIVSNPPYILPLQCDELPESVKLWESRIALVGDEKREAKQYLYYKEIVEAAPKLLKPRKRADEFPWPSVVLEVGLQAEAVASVLEKYPGWSTVKLLEDFARQPRLVTGVFTDGSSVKADKK